MKNKKLNLWFDILHAEEDKQLDNHYLDFIKEEVEELIEQINFFKRGINIDKLNPYQKEFLLKHMRKEMMDVLVVIQGWYYKAGLSLEEDMNMVCASNFSKIYESEEEALKDLPEVAAKYGNDEESFYVQHQIDNYYTIRRVLDGKVMKPTKYKKAEL